MKSMLVIGMGRFGRHCVRTLAGLGHDVMAIDINESDLDAIADVATSCQIGDATDRNFLKSIGIADFDVAIVTIGDNFQASLEATYNCKDLGCPLVVARASREVHAQFLERNGADKVIYPEKQMAVWTAVTYSSKHIFDYVQLENGYGIYEIDVPEKWIGQSLIQLDVRKRYGINVLAVKVNGKFTMDFKPTQLFNRDMHLYILGDDASIVKYFKTIR